MEQEKRRAPRFPFFAPAEIMPEDGSGAMSTRVKELSLYGCYLELSSPLASGTPVVVKIFAAPDFFEALATVVYVDPRLGMGLAFRNVKPLFLSVLQKWLQVALQELPPSPL
jgi:hypothetical protein